MDGLRTQVEVEWIDLLKAAFREKDEEEPGRLQSMGSQRVGHD